MSITAVASMSVSAVWLRSGSLLLRVISSCACSSVLRDRVWLRFAFDVMGRRLRLLGRRLGAYHARRQGAKEARVAYELGDGHKGGDISLDVVRFFLLGLL